MLSGVSTLRIQPLKTYDDGIERKTTITGFDEILKKEADSTTKSIQVKQTVSQKQTTKKAESTDSSSEQVVLYKDPKTGQTVKYVDIAENEEKKADATSSSKKASTTSATSMKKTKYDAIFKKAAKKYNVSESLLKAMAKAESNFNANAVSSAGAMGVMQLMPLTAKGLGVDDPYDPEQNIMGGAKYIAAKLEEFDGNVRLALAAYNAGSGAVRRNGGVPSYCKSYINKVLSYKEAFETANTVG